MYAMQSVCLSTYIYLMLMFPDVSMYHTQAHIIGKCLHNICGWPVMCVNIVIWYLGNKRVNWKHTKPSQLD